MMRNNPTEAIDYMVGGTLMKRLASPDEMVGAALLLTSGRRQLHHRSGHHR